MCRRDTNYQKQILTHTLANKPQVTHTLGQKTASHTHLVNKPDSDIKFTSQVYLGLDFLLFFLPPTGIGAKILGL